MGASKIGANRARKAAHFVSGTQHALGSEIRGTSFRLAKIIRHNPRAASNASTCHFPILINRPKRNAPRITREVNVAAGHNPGLRDKSQRPSQNKNHVELSKPLSEKNGRKTTSPSIFEISENSLHTSR
jgi:hypothetical protein